MTLSEELLAEAERWTDYPHLRERRRARAARAELLRQAADAAKGHDVLCEELQTICEALDCPPGMNRMAFLRERLGLNGEYRTEGSK